MGDMWFRHLFISIKKKFRKVQQRFNVWYSHSSIFDSGWLKRITHFYKEYTNVWEKTYALTIIMCIQLKWVYETRVQKRDQFKVLKGCFWITQMPVFLASRGDEFNPGPEMRLDHSELLCNKVLLKYKGDRESFWHRHQKGVERVPPC